MDEQAQRREVIAEARRTLERLEREERGDLIRKVRATAAEWTPRPIEPVKPERKLDTMPQRTDLVYKRNDDVNEVDQPDSAPAQQAEADVAAGEILDALNAVTEACEQAFANCERKIAKLETASAQLEARLAGRIAGLAALIAGSPSDENRGVVDDLPNPLSPRGRTVN